MNKVRAALLPAGCTSKEAEGGSGLWVMVSIWAWPLGLGRWRYVVTALRHPLVAPPFRSRLDKWKRAITLEEVSFHLKKKRKESLITKWLTLDFKVSSRTEGGKGRCQRVKLAQWVLSLLSRAAYNCFGRRNNNRWLKIKCNSFVTWNFQMTKVSIGCLVLLSLPLFVAGLYAWNFCRLKVD